MPLGSPVDPEVKKMYASSDRVGSVGNGSMCVGSVVRMSMNRRAASPSTVVSSPSPPATLTTVVTAAMSAILALLESGRLLSMGTATAPRSRTAVSAITNERLARPLIATRSPVATPASWSVAATAPTAATSSAYDSSPASSMSAGAAGSSAVRRRMESATWSNTGTAIGSLRRVEISCPVAWRAVVLTLVVLPLRARQAVQMPPRRSSPRSRQGAARDRHRMVRPAQGCGVVPPRFRQAGPPRR